jgi:iron complex outermembrane receptor protein
MMKRSKITNTHLMTIGALIIGAPLQAQEAQTDADTNDKLGDVVVTGTRVQDRSRLETASPVDVLSSAALTEQGSTELAEAMSTIAPSIDFPRPAVTDGTDHVRPVTLRGLSPDQTLVLVNSKRRHTSALVNVNSSVGRGSSAVDLNALPMAAIERIEVLRDGASAQYGSDAIAGVVNIRLREASKGGNASVTYGQYDTDVDTARISRSESDGQTVTASAWAGFPLASEGFLTLSAEYRDRDPTSRGDLDPRPGVNRVDSRFGDPEVTDKTVYLNAGSPLGGDWDTYGWAGYQHRDGAAAATPRIFSNVNNDPAVYPNGFLPIITSDIDDIAAGWGFKGPLAGWDADVSLVYGRNQFDFGVEDTLNGSLVPNSPTSFDAGGIEYDQIVFNFGVVHGYDFGFAKPANLALGVEGRREGYSISAGEPDSYRRGPNARPGTGAGAQGFPGFQPQNELDESRNSQSLYADLETQITEKFLTDIAVRGEHYSDFGSNATGKLSVRYDFTPAFALRGTASTGFRAPSLQQEFFTSTATNFLGTQAVDIGTFPATSAAAKALGARELDPEKSKNFSVGAVFQRERFEATIDAYQIKIDDRIVLSENISATGRPDIAALLAPFNVGAARFFINGVDTKTKGVDLVVRYSLPLAGKLDLTASGNYNETDITKLPQTATLSALNPPPPLFAAINQIIFEEGTPKDKLTLAADWNRPVTFGKIGATLKATRYGKVTDPGTTQLANGTIADSQFVMGSKTLMDLELRARVGSSFSAGIGVDNVFDTYPDKVPAAFNNFGLLGFSRYSPFGFNGRFIYGRLGWNW